MYWLLVVSLRRFYVLQGTRYMWGLPVIPYVPRPVSGTVRAACIYVRACFVYIVA